MPLLRFTIPGPAKAKGRPRFSRRGKGVHVRTPAATKAYEAKVGALCAAAMSEQRVAKAPADALCTVIITVLRKGIERPVTPDLDNVAKVILDGLNGVVWHDDNQVSRLWVEREKAESNSVMVRVRWEQTGQGRPEGR